MTWASSPSSEPGFLCHGGNPRPGRSCCADGAGWRLAGVCAGRDSRRRFTRGGGLWGQSWSESRRAPSGWGQAGGLTDAHPLLSPNASRQRSRRGRAGRGRRPRPPSAAARQRAPEPVRRPPTRSLDGSPQRPPPAKNIHLLRPLQTPASEPLHSRDSELEIINSETRKSSLGLIIIP